MWLLGRRDIRGSGVYQEAESLFRALRQPGTGQISDAAELHASPDGLHAVFAGVIIDELEGTPPTRICQANLRSGVTRVLTFGPNTDRLPKYSPDGRQVAFLSDRRNAGDFQLQLLDPISGEVRATPPVDGWVEYLHWSPNGRRILLGVAGHGADRVGGQGAITSKQAVGKDMPSWMPTLQTGGEAYRWRRAWIYEPATDCLRQVSPADLNIWEATWCGNDAIAAVVSPGPGEGLWYSARLRIIEIQTGNSREVYAPRDQLGGLAASASGKHLAVVEAVCSDRGVVAGDLQLIKLASGRVQRVDTHGVDIAYTEWRSDGELLLAGYRGFETLVGLCEADIGGTFTEVWRSQDLAAGEFSFTLSGLNTRGDCVLVSESFMRAPELAVIRRGRYQKIRSFDLGYAEQTNIIEAVERVCWQAPDGLEIQGWLLRPNAPCPHPLVMSVHGGPVWHWHPLWLGRRRVSVLMLVKRGFAVFFPNPRGSSGRGQDFARRVQGDMCGADTDDYLSGLDHLVQIGVADPKRLGLTGQSYGGYMTSWLITQDSRFAAAVPVAPATNRVSYYLLSHIPQFASLFLGDAYNNATGKFFQRSPIMHAHKTKTPTLNICGALDRCTPPEEAMQFHNALLENGVRSVLVTYPEEGHGVSKFPAAIDYAARLASWFQEHMSPDDGQLIG